MEYFKEPSLENVILNDHDVIKLMIFLVKFMYILHTNNLSYTDMKPSNIILTSRGFKIIDVDTINPLIQTHDLSKCMVNTVTTTFNIAQTNYFTVHQLNQLVTCIYTCLQLMNGYPNCKGSQRPSSVLRYGSYLLELASLNHLKNASMLENPQTFNKYLIKLASQTHNLAYSLLSLIYLYILLIPKYTIAYINAEFVCNTLIWYNKSVPRSSTPYTLLCGNKNLVKIYKDIIQANCVKRWTKDTIPAEEVLKIPQIINYEVYQKILPSYIQEYKKVKFPAIMKSQYNEFLKNDRYTNFRIDPRATIGTRFYKRI